MDRFITGLGWLTFGAFVGLVLLVLGDWIRWRLAVRRSMRIILRADARRKLHAARFQELDDLIREAGGRT